jgi:tryptophan synthase beta subunit
LILDGENEFDQDVLTLDNNFRTKYEQLFKMYNGSHCAMVLIKNVTTTTKGDRYLRAQHNIILTKFVDKATQTHLL